MDELLYHRDRATAELDLGLSAGSLAAARSHLKLSSLHFAKFKALENASRREVKVRRPTFTLD